MGFQYYFADGLQDLRMCLRMSNGENIKYFSFLSNLSLRSSPPCSEVILVSLSLCFPVAVVSVPRTSGNYILILGYLFSDLFDRRSLFRSFISVLPIRKHN